MDTSHDPPRRPKSRSESSAGLPAPSQLRSWALAAAEGVGAELSSAFRTGVRAETKTSFHDLVTAFDTATEAALIQRLTQDVPGSTVLGEESSQPADRARPVPSGVQWIVDPIDGTSNFAHGFALFSVSIAAAIDGEVVAGVVHDPVNQQTFSADDDGAYLSTPATDHARLPIVADSRRSGPALNLITSFPAAEVLASHRQAALDIYADLVQSHSAVRRVISGALELCHAAAGWADVVLGVDTKPWDIAAGMLILRRAGGRFDTVGGADQHARHYLGLAPGISAPAAAEGLRRIAALG